MRKYLSIAACLLATLSICAQVSTITVTSDEPVAAVAVTHTGADAYTLTLSGNAVYPAAAADPDVTLWFANPVSGTTIRIHGYLGTEPAWCPYRAVTVTGIVVTLAYNGATATTTYDVGYYTGAVWTSLLSSVVSYTSAETGPKVAALAATPTAAVGKCVTIVAAQAGGNSGTTNGLTVRIAYQ